MLQGGEEGWAGGIGSRTGRVAASAIVARVSSAAGPGAGGVIAALRRGAGPAERNIVLACKSGLIVDRKADLIGEDAGEIRGGLVGGAVGGRSAKDYSTAVVVRFALCGAVGLGGGRAGLRRWTP